MRRPATRTMLLGHPLVATPLTLGGTAGLFAALYGGANGSGLLPALFCVVVALTAHRASQQADAYKAWKREWDAMTPQAPPRVRRRPSAWTWIIGFIVVGVVGLEWLGGADGRLMAWGAGFTLGGIGLAAVIVAAIRWLWRGRRRRPETFAVTVIARSVLPVPSLDGAYRALPDYCQRLLARPGS